MAEKSKKSDHRYWCGCCEQDWPAYRFANHAKDAECLMCTTEKAKKAKEEKK